MHEEWVRGARGGERLLQGHRVGEAHVADGLEVTNALRLAEHVQRALPELEAAVLPRADHGLGRHGRARVEALGRHAQRRLDLARRTITTTRARTR